MCDRATLIAIAEARVSLRVIANGEIIATLTACTGPRGEFRVVHAGAASSFQLIVERRGCKPVVLDPVTPGRVPDIEMEEEK